MSGTHVRSPEHRGISTARQACGFRRERPVAGTWHNESGQQACRRRPCESESLGGWSCRMRGRSFGSVWSTCRNPMEHRFALKAKRWKYVVARRGYVPIPTGVRVKAKDRRGSAALSRLAKSNVEQIRGSGHVASQGRSSTKVVHRLADMTCCSAGPSLSFIPVALPPPGAAVVLGNVWTRWK